MIPKHDRIRTLQLILTRGWSVMHVRPFEEFSAYCVSPPVTPTLDTPRSRKTQCLEDGERLRPVGVVAREPPEFSRHVTDNRCYHTRLVDASLMRREEEDCPTPPPTEDTRCESY